MLSKKEAKGVSKEVKHPFLKKGFRYTVIFSFL